MRFVLAILSMAASPTFFAMAYLAHADSSGMMHHQSTTSSMALMYLLMGVFHIAPWFVCLMSIANAPGQFASSK